MAIRHSITLSTTEPNNEVGVIKIRQADEQTQTLEVQITENGVPKSYQGMAVYFCAKLGQTAGLGIIEQKLKPEEMTNPANGKLEYTMRAEDWQILGRQKGYFSFRKMKNEHEFIEQFTTRDFTFEVIKSVYSDGLKEVKKDGSTYVWTIEELIRLFNEYMASGKSDWEEFVEQNREVLESVDPGGKLIGELIDARRPFGSEAYATLGERLDSEKAEVTAQLAQTAKSLDYYLPTVKIEAVDGTGSINAQTIKASGMIALYDDLVNRFPNYVIRRSLGLDTSGLFTVYVYDFIFNVPGDYIVMDTNIHGDGPGGDPKDNSIALYYFFKDLCENWENNDKLSAIHNAVNFSVIPVANPWGYDNDSRNNVNGVDLNRNFSWNHTPSALSGQTPFSEKETQYIRDNLEHVKGRLFNTKQKIIAYIPFHSYGDLTITPRFPYAISTTTPLVVVFRNVAKYLSEKYGYVNYDGVSAATASSADNYAERILGIPAGTPEFPIFRDDGHVRDAFAMKQHVEFYGNLIYQTVNMNIMSKTKLSHLNLDAQVEIPKGSTYTFTNLVSRYSENYFPYDAATGEITIPDTMYVSIDVQVSLLSDQSVTADVPFGLYIYKNGGTMYEGVGAFESVIRLGGATSREKNYTVQVKTPAIHCAKGDKIKVGVYHNQAAGTVKTASNGKATWISVEEVIRYK